MPNLLKYYDNMLWLEFIDVEKVKWYLWSYDSTCFQDDHLQMIKICEDHNIIRTNLPKLWEAKFKHENHVIWSI